MAAEFTTVAHVMDAFHDLDELHAAHEAAVAAVQNEIANRRPAPPVPDTEGPQDER